MVEAHRKTITPFRRSVSRRRSPEDDTVKAVSSVGQILQGALREELSFLSKITAGLCGHKEEKKKLEAMTDVIGIASDGIWSGGTRFPGGGTSGFDHDMPLLQMVVDRHMGGRSW